jgi:hypothetical protein
MKLIHFIQGQFLSFLDTYSSRKLYTFLKTIMRCDVTPVIFAYETKLNILKREQVTKIL